MKKILAILFVLVLLVIGAGGVYAYLLIQPVSPTPTPIKQFIIPKGQAVSVIANRLHAEGFIKHPLIFRLVAKQTGLDRKLQAGTFELSSHMTVQEIAQKLTMGTADLWVTIPEGWRREEIAESLATQDIENFDSKKFLELSSTSEGKLFPDTYLVPKQMTTEDLYELLTDTFDKKITQGLATEIEQSEHSFEEALIMASILEREAQGFEDMQHVAGILWKRLEIGMPLQADATLQYAKGYNKIQKDWWAPPTAEDKKFDSPFNTYQNPGLPPRPISNPGVEAMKAALNPVETDDLFYIHDTRGQIHYAETLDEHNANVQKYLR